MDLLDKIKPHPDKSNNISQQERKTQIQYLDPDMVYWDEMDEVYFHSSGMYFDPVAKAYYTLIDHIGGDLRLLYYIQLGGDFSLAQKGNWDRVIRLS